MIVTGNPMQLRIRWWFKRKHTSASPRPPAAGHLAASVGSALAVLGTMLLAAILGWIVGEPLLEAARAGLWTAALGLIVLLVCPQLCRLLAIPYAIAAGLGVVYLSHLVSDADTVFNLWPVWAVMTAIFAAMFTALHHVTPALARLPAFIRVTIWPAVAGALVAPAATLLLASSHPVGPVTLEGLLDVEVYFLGLLYIGLVGLNTAICFRVVRASAGGPAWTRWGAGVALAVGVWWVTVSIIVIVLSMLLMFLSGGFLGGDGLFGDADGSDGGALDVDAGFDL